MLSQFPLEIWVKISYNLDKFDIFQLSLTNKSMYNIMTSDSIWWSKIRKSWYMTDYNEFTLTYKKKLKKNESCFDYFKRKKNDDKFVKNCIDLIENYKFKNLELDLKIKEKLIKIYNNFDDYLPYLLSESLHLTISSFNNNLINANDFINLQKRRNLKLNRIYIASNILENGKYFKCLKLIQNSLINLPNDLESVLLILSLFDSRYYELLLIRHSVIKNVINNFNSVNFDQNTKPVEKILFLVTILHRIIENKKCKILLYNQNQNQTQKKTIEDLSILRFYCGDSDGTPLIKNAIIEKLCKLLNLDRFIEINESCIRISNENKYLYLFIDDNQMYLKNENEVHPILKKFPMENPNYLILKNKISNNNLIEKKKIVYLSKFFDYFSDIIISRFDDFRGADQIVYQKIKNDKIVTVLRNNYIQGQILCCGGFVNRNGWILIKKIFNNEFNFDNDLKLISFFNLPILEKEKKNDSNYQINNLNDFYLNGIFHDLKWEEIEKIKEKKKEIIWECEQLSIGDIVWSDASQARGVIIEISDSLEDELNSKDIGLNNAYTLKRKIIKLKGTSLFTIFFGAYGFATFTRQYLKKDKTDRVEGLLVYDLIGCWFSHYDYDSHKFIYRHQSNLLN